MSNLQIQFVRPPFDEPQLASAAIAALSRADAMGLLSQQITCLDNSAMQGLQQGMAEAGIGRTLLANLHRQPCSDPVPLLALLKKINEALDQISCARARVAHPTGCIGAGFARPSVGNLPNQCTTLLVGQSQHTRRGRWSLTFHCLCRRRSRRGLQRHRRSALVRPRAQPARPQHARTDARRELVAR